VMAAKQTDLYLETLKSWLSRNRYPGDLAKLRKTLSVLEGLVGGKLEAEERTELRGLVKTCFSLTDEQLEGYLPSASVYIPPTQPELDRGPFPPVGGYLQDYIKLTSSQESPESFHAMALMTCLGAFMGRRCWIDRKWFKVRPNMATILTGPAGGPKKTTAWELALATVQGAMRGMETRIISDASPQALVEELARDQQDAVGMIWAPEFRNFFPSSTYMEGVVPLLTRLMDDPPEYPVARITRRVSAIRNVTVSLAGGSTLDWMAKLPQDAQGGGFLTRIVVVHEEKAKTPVQISGAEKVLAAAKVRDMICAIARYGTGEVRLSQDGEAWFADWYKKTKQIKDIAPRLTLYYNRKQIHLLRVAMLMRLPSKTLTAEDLEKTRVLMDWMEAPLADVYRLIGMNKAGEMTRLLLDTLRSRGGVMDYDKALREVKGVMNRRDFDMAVDTLVGAGQLRVIDSAMERKLVVKDLGVVE